ncbi:hypothetical protein ACFQ7B_07655 [Streptomyces erythrochromogenes]|uniref:hypothetical protein n=1 Tax=Streptomyces erythrochromogenes TaxID=285574 RepID=UPI0036CED175
MIENFDNPTDRDALLLLAMGGECADDLITGQERRGQQQLVNSDRLPAQFHGDRAAYEALGFTLGAPDPADPLFAPATLPAGWTREASDHDMWSYILDGLGRRRVSIFYKAAFYDRSAHMSLVGLAQYLREHVLHGQQLITDDTWATLQALAAEARAGAERAQREADSWNRHGHQEYAVRYTRERDLYAAAAAHFGAGEQQA